MKKPLHPPPVVVASLVVKTQSIENMFGLSCEFITHSLDNFFDGKKQDGVSSTTRLIEAGNGHIARLKAIRKIMLKHDVPIRRPEIA